MPQTAAYYPGIMQDRAGLRRIAPHITNYKNLNFEAIVFFSVMPRTYVKRNLRAKWSLDNLRNAVVDIKSGKGSIREISRTYSIPVRTLMRRLKSGNLTKIPLGRKCYLSSHYEGRLVEYIQRMERNGFALTSKDVKMLAYSFAVKKNLPHNFNAEKKQAGDDWFRLFMKRHPELSIRQSQGMSTARAQGMNRDECKRYFELLDQILTENDLKDCPRKILNLDE